MHDAMTRYIHAGRTPQAFGGLVNTPVFRGSTVLADSFASWEASKKNGNPYSNYGRFGTPTTRSFEQAMAELDAAQERILTLGGSAR